MNISLWFDNEEFRLGLNRMEENKFQVKLKDKTFNLSVEFVNDHEILLNVDGRIHNAIVCSNTTSHSVFMNGRSFKLEKKSASQILGDIGERQVRKDVKTSMPGRIVDILIQEGENVEEGEAVLILEAMKMQNEIKSPRAGILTHLKFKPGDLVETGVLLFTVE
jgi:biotin carboxyl carrier protein